ncbi:MAG: zinc metallopeptidase [Clostridia bacterium]|nr:zinc metallopeptidase [Clostridia bacterium]
MVEWMYIIVSILILPGIIFGIVAQVNVTNTFNSFKDTASSSGKTASEVAREMLDQAGLHDVQIQKIRGELTDNYDPKKRILSLSESTYSSTSVAAIGVAAHEVGHAIQHKEKYAPLVLRNTFVPFVNFASYMFWPLMIAGVILNILLYTSAGMIVIWISVALYGSTTLFYLITVPVEYNASNRALAVLGRGILAPEELPYANKVLRAAGQTYVAALITSALYFLQFFLRILIVFGRRD